MSVSQSPDMIVLRLLSSPPSMVPPNAYSLESFGGYWCNIVVDL
jgi:hypothetical protein